MEENNCFTTELPAHKCVIQCPHCGAEYLFEEIFMADDVVGTRHAIKDEKGKIVFIEGDDPDLMSEYICDYCDKKFTVSVDMTFWTGVVQDLWEDEYSVEIFKDRIPLEE